MPLPSTKTEFQSLLYYDQQCIQELQTLIEQNKLEGKSNQKLYKAIIIAMEKRIKHLIEYEKRYKELPNEEPQNETQSQNDDNAPTNGDQLTESNSVQTKPKTQSGINKSAATKSKSKTKPKRKYRLSKKPFKNKKTETTISSSADP